MSMTSEELVFECSAASVYLDGAAALSGVDFNLRTGEFMALLGDNGAGKSSLVKALLGLVQVQSGSVRVFGTDVRKFKRWDRIGYVPQRIGARSAVPATVGEVVLSGRASFFRPLPGYSRRDRTIAVQALEAVRLHGDIDRPIGSLSGGQQQRVLIARALAREPDVLILDEPAAGIDAESHEALANTLGVLHREGRTVLMVAHGLGPLASLVSRTVVLDAGRVVYDGPPVGAGEGHLHIHHHPEELRHTGPVLHEGARPPR